MPISLFFFPKINNIFFVIHPFAKEAYINYYFKLY